mmetsp:Transcript_50860/g.115691  ORF Transcript_50860/g.115691 Transcript_50860/m.115691 type:complete len:387 (-) Transcript_50860:110-1270(-)
MPVEAATPPFLDQQRLHGQHHQLLPSQKTPGTGLNTSRPVEVAVKMPHAIGLPHSGDPRGCEVHHLHLLVVLAHTNEALDAGGHCVIGLQLLSPQKASRCSLDLGNTMTAVLQTPPPEVSTADLLDLCAALVLVPPLTAPKKTSDALLKHHRSLLALAQPPPLGASDSHPRQQPHSLIHLRANMHLLVLLPPGLQDHRGVGPTVEDAHSLVPSEQGLQFGRGRVGHALDLLGDLVARVPATPERLDTNSCPVLHKSTTSSAANPEGNLSLVVVRTPRRDTVIHHFLLLASPMSITSQCSTVPLPGGEAAEHGLDTPGGRLPVAAGCHRHALARPILHALLEGADSVDALHSGLVPLVSLNRFLPLVLLLPTLVKLVRSLDLRRPTA